MEKKLLRKETLQKRAKLDRNIRMEYSDSIINKLMDTIHYINASTIMTFISFNHEVDTHRFIKEGIKSGKNMVVPISIHETRELKLSLVKDFNELETGYFNILTPKQEFIRIIDPQTVDLVIVPGNVFDRDGYRVGYGGGYYDRFLSKIDKNVPKIAIAFDLQLVDKVPREYYDIPVDYIITEKELINCKGK